MISCSISEENVENTADDVKENDTQAEGEERSIDSSAFSSENASLVAQQIVTGVMDKVMTGEFDVDTIRPKEADEDQGAKADEMENDAQNIEKDPESQEEDKDRDTEKDGGAEEGTTPSAPKSYPTLEKVALQSSEWDKDDLSEAQQSAVISVIASGASERREQVHDSGEDHGAATVSERKGKDGVDAVQGRSFL